jgi:histidine ammonia-lyase
VSRRAPAPAVARAERLGEDAPAAAPAPAVVVLDGRGLTSAAVAAVAERRADVRLAAGARERNAQARAALEAIVAAGRPVYGVTTGVGALHDQAVPAADAPEHQRRLLRSHAGGAGEPLAPVTVRAAMAVRANQIAAGGAGVSDGLLDALCAALEADVVPVAREVGGLGTGDLPALADIGLALLGEGGAAWQGRVLPAAGALRRAGLRPLTPGPRDGIALLSSNAVTIASAALAAVRARALLDSAPAVAALSFEAVGADRGVLDARVHAAHPHPGQVAVAARMRALLADGDPPRHGPGVHDPFAFRCQPQVDGAALDALDALERVLAVELNAGAENPLLAPGPPPEALTSGNFHAVALALALDGLRAALAQWASLVAARASALLDDRFSGLPGWLAGRGDAASGAMALEYTAHGAAAEVRALAAPATAQHTSVGAGMESHAPFAPVAVRQAHAALERCADALATELVLAMRALHARGRPPAGAGTRPLHARLRAALGTTLEDRPLADDVQAARRLLGGLGKSEAGGTPGPAQS